MPSELNSNLASLDNKTKWKKYTNTDGVWYVREDDQIIELTHLHKTWRANPNNLTALLVFQSLHYHLLYIMLFFSHWYSFR